MHTRRRILHSIGFGTAILIPGCTGSTSSSGPNCETTLIESGDSELLYGTPIIPEDGDAILEVPLSRPEIDEYDVDSVKIFKSDGDLEHEIPIPSSTNRESKGNYEEYYLTLGPIPIHGRYRLEVLASNGDILDYREFNFNCFAAEKPVITAGDN